MKNKTYYLSIIFTSLVCLFLFTKALGFIFWINGAPIDKWVALVGLFTIPIFTYYSFTGPFKNVQKIITKEELLQTMKSTMSDAINKY